MYVQTHIQQEEYNKEGEYKPCRSMQSFLMLWVTYVPS